MPRKVSIEVTNTQDGTGLVAPYSHAGGRVNGEQYRVPLYKMLVSGTDNGEQRVTETFRVIRFGVEDRKGARHIVGLSRAQTHTLTRSDSVGGSWRIRGGHLLHDGANNPSTQAWGSIGCIEVTGWHDQTRRIDAWNHLESLITELSGTNDRAAITRARTLTMSLQAAGYPPLQLA